MISDIQNMLSPDVYDHPVSKLELIETHISWVVLTGDYAYKIKKPVNFGFLDFSTLDKRKEYCQQELRLNRRLAPDIYLDVVAISGSEQKPVISSSAEAFEYAVKMRQFPQSAQLDNMLAAGELGNEHIDPIAGMVADFHLNTTVATDSSNYGSNESIFKPVRENFELINRSLKSSDYESKLDELKDWSYTEFKKLESVFEQRKLDGFIRECHGDMHLRNLVWLDGKALAFDCIEFNSNLRWIDVISEVAFLIMDLQDRQQDQLANRFLNSYLEKTGDYAGLSVLPFYLCYRAMVRAKVDALRIEQINDDTKIKELTEFKSYIELALRYTKKPIPTLIIMRGLSASGKSTVSQQLLETIGAIRIRSDVERKRLFDISLDEHSVSDIEKGIYTSEASNQTYEKLLQLSATVVSAGFTVIVDAAFLDYEQRHSFQSLAKHLSVPYIILEVSAPFEVLRQRIIARKNDVSDADLTVLEHQISQWRPLHADEDDSAIRINTENPLDIKSLLTDINEITRLDTGTNS